MTPFSKFFEKIQKTKRDWALVSTHQHSLLPRYYIVNDIFSLVLVSPIFILHIIEAVFVSAS